MDLTKKTNKKNRLIITILLILAFLAFFFIVFNRNSNSKADYQREVDSITIMNEKSLLNINEKIEYGTTWKYDDFLNRVIDDNRLTKNTEIILSLDGNKITQNSEYTFDKLENHELIVELFYEYKNEEKHISKEIKNDKKYALKVVDTIAPVIDGLTDKTITEGETLDLKSGIIATDNVDGEVEVVIVNNADLTQAGVYKIEVNATDLSGNKAFGEFTLTINKKTIATTKPTTTKSTTTKKTTTTTKKTTTKTPTTIANDASTKEGRLNLAKAEAKRVASQIIKPEMTDEQKAYAIFIYLHSNVALQTNQSSEAYKTNFGNEAYAALIMKIAACSGFCKAVTLLCNEAGLQSEHVNAGQWAHQWNRVLINGEWIVLDAQGGIFGGTVHPLE